MQITSSILYDYIKCPHKVWRDKYGPQTEKIQETNPFIKLLWEKGIQHEKSIMVKFGERIIDLSEGEIDDRITRTEIAMKEKPPIIYQGVLKRDDLFGIPDLLKLHENGKYLPIDIKSGQGYEGAEDLDDENAKLKKHYAVQLCLYIEILEKMNCSSGRHGIIIDIKEDSAEYDLMTTLGSRSSLTYWGFYEQIKSEVISLLSNNKQNDPALSSICKLCNWYTSCKTWCTSSSDPTLIFYVGRGIRDSLKRDLNILSIPQLLELNVADVIDRKKRNKEFLKGIGESTLSTAIRRGKLLIEKSEPIAMSKFDFPKAEYELFFDIEDDPTQEIVYLHGVYERTKNSEIFRPFVAENTETKSEKAAWQKFWEYIGNLPQGGFVIYYYSSHEKSVYRRLQKKYPDVISEEELKNFFESLNVIDLYQVVLRNTDWPVGSYSIKELATYCGFKWRDETPSGALSIQWYNEYLKSRDPQQMKRILEYNEDDCKATLILKDRLHKMFLNKDG
jgi:predicted RecB family nuclease